MKQTFARVEGEWESGFDWAAFMNTINYTPGTYFNNGNGSWSYCPDCAAQVNLQEVVVYGTKPNYTPINLSTSDLWNNKPQNNVPQWRYWDYGGGGSWSEVVPNTTPDDIFDPYNTLYHNSNKQSMTNTWSTTKFEQFIYKCFNGLVFDFILGPFFDILQNYIDVYWNENGDIIPNYIIEHQLSCYYVPTYNWSGKVTVAKVNNKICAVVEYSDSFNVNRQIGKTTYSERIVNSTSGTVITYLWNNYVGLEGSISDVRCGKPSIGQNLFISCTL